MRTILDKHCTRLEKTSIIVYIFYLFCKRIHPIKSSIFSSEWLTWKNRRFNGMSTFVDKSSTKRRRSAKPFEEWIRSFTIAPDRNYRRSSPDRRRFVARIFIVDETSTIRSRFGYDRQNKNSPIVANFHSKKAAIVKCVKPAGTEVVDFLGEFNTYIFQVDLSVDIRSKTTFRSNTIPTLIEISLCWCWKTYLIGPN